MHIVFWHPKVWLSPSNYVLNLRCMDTPFAVEIIQKQQRPNQQSTNAATESSHDMPLKFCFIHGSDRMKENLMEHVKYCKQLRFGLRYVSCEQRREILSKNK